VCRFTILVVLIACRFGCASRSSSAKRGALCGADAFEQGFTRKPLVGWWVLASVALLWVLRRVWIRRQERKFSEFTHDLVDESEDFESPPVRRGCVVCLPVSLPAVRSVSLVSQAAGRRPSSRSAT
jgi:hypothetical protein